MQISKITVCFGATKLDLLLTRRTRQERVNVLCVISPGPRHPDVIERVDSALVPGVPLV